MTNRKVKSARAETETDAETVAALFIKTVIERNARMAAAVAALSVKAMAGRKVNAARAAALSTAKAQAGQKAKAARGAAGLTALARVGGKGAVREALIAALRAQDDPILLGLADLLDDAVRTDLSIDIIFSWTGHDNRARDVEIAASVEQKVRAGTKQIAVFSEVATAYGISAKRVEILWQKHRKKMHADEAFLAKAARWKPLKT